MLIVACAVGASVLGLVIGLLRGASYTATAQVVLARPISGALLGGPVAANESARTAATQLRILQSDRVRGAAEDELGHPVDVRVVAVEESDIAEVSASAPSATQAANDANGYASVYVSSGTEQINTTTAAAITSLETQLSELQDQLDPLEERIRDLATDSTQLDSVTAEVTPIRNALLDQQNDLMSRLADLKIRSEIASAAPTIAAPAVEPTSSSTSYPTFYGGLGLAFGVLLSIWLAFTLERRRGRIVDETDVRLGGVEKSTVVSIPSVGGSDANSGLSVPGSPAIASYRRLAATLAPVERGRPWRTFSVIPVDDESSAAGPAADLALALSALGRRVALVDADIKSPVLHELFDIPDGAAGLQDVLLRRTRLAESLCAVRGLLLLPAGRRRAEAQFDVGSFAAVIAELRKLADVVVVSVPAFDDEATALAVAPHVDGSVLVVTRGRSLVSSLREAAAMTPYVELAAVVLMAGTARRRAGASPPHSVAPLAASQR